MGKIIIGGSAAPNLIQSEPQVEQLPVEITIKEIEKIVEVPVEKIVTETVYVDNPIEVHKEVFVDRVVEKPVEVIKEVERIVEVPVEVIKEVPVEVIVEKIVYQPVEVQVEKEIKVIKKIVPKWAIMVAAIELAIIILLIISRS
jgi:hypothetical protein